MNREGARIAIYTRIESIKAAQLPNVQVLLPNMQERDVSDRSAHLRVQIVYLDSYQASLGQVTKHRRSVGNLVLEAWVNKGEGEKKANDILAPLVQIGMGTLPGSVRMRAAKDVPYYEKDGWMVYPIIIPFWFDEIS